ncbi:MAG TPA: hypothetical protein VMM93_09380 [Vicinamibacterales bacterium]|nr:hypothetical protein [Vicinamibacterales bacterium]
MAGPIAGMIVAALGVWGAAVVAFGPGVGWDVALGLAGPVVAVVASWVAIVRAHRQDPASVTGVLLRGFAGKMVFFGAYVVGVWLLAEPEPTAFIASFTGSFLGLYLAEAVLLQRLGGTGLRT